jgi:hypothetical protein
LNTSCNLQNRVGSFFNPAVFQDPTWVLGHWSKLFSDTRSPITRRASSVSPIPSHSWMNVVVKHPSSRDNKKHMFTIVMYDLRPNAFRHHIRVCACMTAQFAFFSRDDSGVLLTVINDQLSDWTLSIHQTAKNVSHNQAALHSLRECPQLKTTPTTVSTSSSPAGKCYVTTTTQISTGSLKKILRHWQQTRALLSTV